MADYLQNQFQYGGFWYSLTIQLTHEDDTVTLDNNALAQFEYSYSLNQLTYTGSIEYTDNVGVLDRVFKGGRWVCGALLQESTAQDGQQGETSRLQLLFLIDSVSVLERDFQTVRYKFGLIGLNTEYCMANIAFSNYGRDPQPCLDILKACIVSSGQKVDTRMFESVQSKVKINYISNVNSSLIDIVTHLYDKMYSYDEKEDSLIFVNYDFINTGMYQLFDTSRPMQTVTGSRTVVISQQQSGAEGLSQPDPVDIGSRMDVSQIDQIKAFEKKTLWNYDFGSNSFRQGVFDTVQINNMYSAKPDILAADSDKFQLAFDGKIVKHGSCWNNGLDVYEQLEENLGARSVILETTGNVMCRPGYAVYIVQDKVADMGFEDSPKDAHDNTSRYIGFEGLWYVQRVHGYVDVHAQKYRQVLTLIRNYMT